MLMGGIMRNSAEMGSDAMMYIPSFINIGSGIRKFMGGDTNKGTQTNKQQSNVISLFFFKIRRAG
jgi:tetrahydrodipicolinate N-succinyltransferase